jgi:DNA-binding NarL/FixJ family response regulator
VTGVNVTAPSTTASQDRLNRRPSVVITDDEADVRRLLRVNLEVDGRFQVVADLASGEETLELAWETCPDLLVLDLMMPGMNGAEVLSEIRRRCPSTKIAMFSAASTEAAERLTGRKADAYIPKTADLIEVIDRLASLTHQSPPRPPR